MRRLRRKSNAKKEKDRDRDREQQGQQKEDGNAPLPVPTRRPSRRRQQPREELKLDDDNFRTSLILPSLTRRFTLLRGKDGSLLSENEMQSHLRVQRATGRLTESEELMVMQQYRLQSMYEAASSSATPSGRARVNGNGNAPPPPIALDTLHEHEHDNASHSSSYAASTTSRRAYPTGDSVYSALSSSDEHRSRSSGHHTPFSPSSSAGHYSQHPAPQSHKASYASAPASGSHSPVRSASTNGGRAQAYEAPGTGFALSSAADFYAARDAARGNGLFGGGGLERDVLSKMGRSPTLAGAENPGAGVGASGSSSGTDDAGSPAHAISPGSKEPSTPSGRRRIRRLASASSSSSAQSDDLHWSPRAVPPPVPAIRYSRRDEDEYDPYRPKDSDDEEGERDDEEEEDNPALAEEGNTFGAGPVQSELHDVPMSRKQFNRLSRVLEDIERELTHTQYHMAQAGPEPIAEEDQSEHYEDELDEGHDHVDDPHSNRDARSEEHDYSNNSGYSYDRHDHSGYSQEHDLDERGDHLSTASSSDRHPHRAFAYDDTEELEASLAVDGMRSNHSLSGSPRLAFPDERNSSDIGQLEEQEDSRPTSSQPSIVGTVTSEATARPNTLLGVQSQPDPRMSAPNSPGLAYLRATRSPDAHETSASEQISEPHPAHASAQSVSVPASTSARSLASNGTMTSRGTDTDFRPPLSAVQSAFPRSASNRSVQHLRQGSGPMLDIVGEGQSGDGQLQSQQGHDQGYTPAHSRAGSAVSSRSGPPLSPPPTFGLPPLPQSASAASIASLMMDTQQHHHSSLTAHHDSYTPASDVQRDLSDEAAQPLSPAAHAAQTARPPSFSAFTFTNATDSVESGRRSAANGAPAEMHSQMSPKGTPLDGAFPNGRHDGQGNQHHTEAEEQYQHRQHARPDSMESTGSSWRGMGAGNDSDYDLLRALPGSLPASPTKGTVVSKMDRIHENEQEDAERSNDEGDGDDDDARRREDAAVQAFLRDNESGWNLADLRAIQQKLVDSAISRDAPTDGGERQAYSLGSPFSNGEASFPPSTSDSVWMPVPVDAPDSPAPPLLQSPTSVNPALNALRGRASPGHPGTKLYSRPSSPAASTSQRPAHSRQTSTSSLRRVHSPPPDAGYPANEQYFDLQQLQKERSEAADSGPDHGLASPSAFVGVTSPRSPPPIPGSLRSKPTRTSNATPSMLIRHVQQQASEATAALKNTQSHGASSEPPSSGQVASTSSPGPTSAGPTQPRRQLSHRKSAKNLKISGPQFVSASADLESMPTIDTLSTPTKSVAESSPELARKPSSAGLKFRMRFNRSASRKDPDAEHDISPDTSADMQPAGLSPSAVMRNGPMPHSSNGSKGSIPEPRQSDMHSGLKSLMSKLKRRKPSETALSPRLMPDPLILASPQWSDVPALGSPRSTGYSSPSMHGRDTASRAATTRQGVHSVSSTSTDPMIDISPLVISPRGSPLAAKAQQPGGARIDPPRDTATPTRDADRTSAASLDSMRKLFEAATALGLDPERVNELVDAAGYRGQQENANGSGESGIVRPAGSSPADKDSVHRQPATPPRMQHDARLTRTPSSAASMKRSQSSRSRKTSISELADPALCASTSTLRRQASHGTSTSSTRRSVHDRPLTPPPTKAAHRRQVSEALALEHPMPFSPPTAHSWASPTVHPSFAASASSSPMAQTRSAASIVGSGREEEQHPLPVPSAPFMRNGRTSVVSARSFGSYDAKSIYGLYGDEEEDVPPTPGLPDMDMVLASGRIPASTADAKRASVVLAPGLTPAALNRMHRNSRIELAEYDNGDIAFNIIQSLRDASGTNSAGMSAGNRETFYPIGLHRRQTSDLSIEEELASPTPPLPSRAAQAEPDPLRLLVKRNQKPPRPELEDRMPGTTARKLSVAPPEESRSSILEVYEASDETQVAALIEELTRGLDQGQFNLSRSGTLSNSTFTRKQQHS